LFAFVSSKIAGSPGLEPRVSGAKKEERPFMAAIRIPSKRFFLAPQAVAKPKAKQLRKGQRQAEGGAT
jgi:hypothetical protein